MPILLVLLGLLTAAAGAGLTLFIGSSAVHELLGLIVVLNGVVIASAGVLASEVRRGFDRLGRSLAGPGQAENTKGASAVPNASTVDELLATANDEQLERIAAGESLEEVLT